MSILKFTDGEQFDTSGPLRKEKRYDGWYVIGKGVLIPVSSEKEAENYILNKKERNEKLQLRK
jgi:hypothetical protein